MESSPIAKDSAPILPRDQHASIAYDTKVTQLFGRIESLKLSKDETLPLVNKYECIHDNEGIIETIDTCSTVSSCDHDIRRTEMLERVANSDAHFKHQQINEPDLSQAEKREIAADILVRKPGIFLERFGKHLIADDLTFFEQFSDDFYVEFHRKEVLKRLEGSKELCRSTVRNRRYEAMKRLVTAGDYFSDDEMKHRDPLMYEDMIGQHLSEAEISQMVDKSEASLSGILLKHLRVMQNNDQYAIQKEMEECQREEEDDEEEDEASEELSTCMDDGEIDSGKEKVLSDVERATLRSEFISAMQERFLKGEDRNFDYSEVDNNCDYDAVDMLDLDAQEKYFDDDDEELDDDCIHSRSGLESESCNNMAE